MLAVPLQSLPYKKFGITDKQAAAYLLDKFTFGARPGEIERLAQQGEQGLLAWFEAQLQASAPEIVLEERLRPLTTRSMSSAEIIATYPNPAMVIARARRDGIDLKGVAALAGDDSAMASSAQERYRKALREYAAANGIKPQRQLLSELYANKLLRAVYANNQLSEVMADFWFNHFNVSITDNQARPYVLSYERDAIRPHVLGSFRALLGSTAKHPAMLHYLDNAQSTAPDGVPTTASLAFDEFKRKSSTLARGVAEGIKKRLEVQRDSVLMRIPADFRPKRGINENYARELMELHTLGVDGGYTQKDVTEAARVLTGWTVFPEGIVGDKFLERWNREQERLAKAGFVREGAFLFRADAHDATEKTVLGVTFPAGSGLAEGEKLLDMLAEHPSTARFICTKIARRFVSDEPSPSLIATLADVFRSTKGNIAAVLRALVAAPEFWITTTPSESSSALSSPAKTLKSKKTKKTQLAQQPAEILYRSKIKSPFEVVVSALRALDADVVRPRQLVEWVQKMGQPLYACQAPTGFPDRAEAWINTGSLLNRMNFGLALASGAIPGVQLDLAALNHHHEPESAEDALRTYAAILLPERNLTQSIQLLAPMVSAMTANPALAQAVAAAADGERRDSVPQMADMKSAKTKPAKTIQRSTMKRSATTTPEEQIAEQFLEQGDTTESWQVSRQMASKVVPKESSRIALQPSSEVSPQDSVQGSTPVSSTTIARVVGIILGSPEFQRR